MRNEIWCSDIVLNLTTKMLYVQFSLSNSLCSFIPLFSYFILPSFTFYLIRKKKGLILWISDVRQYWAIFESRRWSICVTAASVLGLNGNGRSCFCWPANTRLDDILLWVSLVDTYDEPTYGPASKIDCNMPAAQAFLSGIKCGNSHLSDF